VEAKIITNAIQWNNFVASSPCCNIAQSFEWGKLLFDGTSLGSLHVGVVDNHDQLCAVMLLSICVLPTLSGIYFYAPRGPVLDDPSSPALDILLKYVHAEARKRKALFLKIEPSVPDGNAQWLEALHAQGFHPNPYQMHVRHEWVLDISSDEQSLLAMMKEKWRYNIRLASRKGVMIRESSTAEDITAFYNLYQITSTRDHFPILSRDHYQQAYDLYKKENRALLLLAEHEGQILAGTMTFRLGKWSWYMYGASANEGRNLMPNHLLQWTAIRWAKQCGCTFYNFRGIPEILQPGEEMWGVYEYKQGFGGFPLRFLETHDYIYRPALYRVYRVLQNIKRRLSVHA